MKKVCKFCKKELNGNQQLNCGSVPCKKHHEEYKEYFRQYRIKNKDKIKVARRKIYLRDREEICRKAKEYRLKNKKEFRNICNYCKELFVAYRKNQLKCYSKECEK